MNIVRISAIVAALSMGAAFPAQAQEIACSSFGGLLTGTITEKVLVDVDCRIEDAVVRGNVSFAGPYVLSIADSEVRGNIECDHGGSVRLSHSEVTGNLGDCRGVFPRDKSKGESRAVLGGLEEVPPVSTSGFGAFSAQVDSLAQVLRYELSFDDLDGGDVLFAHIHFGLPGANGGVIAFLCSNVAPPVGVDTPLCPAPGETLESELDPADVIGPEDQGIAPGEANEALQALRDGAGYVNVHTSTFPNGEIRGQILPVRSSNRRR